MKTREFASTFDGRARTSTGTSRLDTLRQSIATTNETVGQVLKVSTAITVFSAAMLLERRGRRGPKGIIRGELDKLAKAGKRMPHKRGPVENPHQHGENTGGHSWGHGRAEPAKNGGKKGPATREAKAKEDGVSTSPERDGGEKDISGRDALIAVREAFARGATPSRALQGKATDYLRTRTPEEAQRDKEEFGNGKVKAQDKDASPQTSNGNRNGQPQPEQAAAKKGGRYTIKDAEGKKTIHAEDGTQVGEIRAAEGKRTIHATDGTQVGEIRAAEGRRAIYDATGAKVGQIRTSEGGQTIQTTDGTLWGNVKAAEGHEKVQLKPAPGSQDQDTPQQPSGPDRNAGQVQQAAGSKNVSAQPSEPAQQDQGQGDQARQGQEPGRDQAGAGRPDRQASGKEKDGKDGAKDGTGPDAPKAHHAAQEPVRSQNERLGGAVTDGGLNEKAGGAVTDGDLNEKVGGEMLGGPTRQEQQPSTAGKDTPRREPPPPPRVPASNRTRDAAAGANAARSAGDREPARTAAEPERATSPAVSK